MLTIFIDFKSAPSLLAMKPTLALAKRKRIELLWEPFASAERKMPDKVPDEAVSLRHMQTRQKAMQDTLALYAKSQGLTLNFPEVPGSTDLALGALALLPNELRLSFIEQAFEVYWDKHADLNDWNVVRVLCEGSEAQGYLNSEAEAHEAGLAAQASAESVGVVGAPCYQIDGQIFVGREHLPWIEELIDACNS